MLGDKGNGVREQERCGMMGIRGMACGNRSGVE